MERSPGKRRMKPRGVHNRSRMDTSGAIGDPMTTEGRLEARRSKSPRGLKTLKIFTRRDNPGRDEGARDGKEVMEVLNSGGRELPLVQGWISRIID